ncbi:MAG TPA: hypothetical protein GX526_03570 [Thermoanaerobacterales bacterium]|nr:hypothetical protein [Thermoanaerobacterales bacterium]
MSIPLVFLPFHLSLTALAGIILGPYFGFLAAFIVNLILAFFGHGGITIVGLNTLIIGSEAILGWFLYNRFNKYMSKKISAGISALFALIISGLLMISIIGITNIDPDIAFHFLDDYAFSGILEHQGKSIFILALILMPLVSLGAIIEGIITYFVVGYINQVKPDILDK